MGFEHKPDSGSIFLNQYKEHDRQPDWTGSAKVGGVDYRLAAWINEGRNGDYLSIKFQEQAEYDRQFGRRDEGRGRDNKTRAAEPGGYRERAAAAKERVAKMRESMMNDSDLSDDDIPF